MILKLNDGTTIHDEIVDALKYYLAGKSVFSLANSLTGRKYSYQIKLVNTPSGVIWFVSVSNGKTFKYLGSITIVKGWKVSHRSNYNRDSYQAKAFTWLYNCLVNDIELPKYIIIEKSGYCSRCQRKLNSEFSKSLGLGQKCYKRLYEVNTL